MTLSYEDIHAYYADQCSICRGNRRVIANGTWTSCRCQYIATARWRLEQIQIFPDILKYKCWSDFTGLIKDNKTTVGCLVPASALQAKNKALRYCFKNSNVDAVKDRKSNLIIHHHLSDGQNVVISGPRNTGKSLLACLILKEFIYATSYFDLRYDYKWVKSNSLIDAARWDNNKSIDRDFLDDIESSGFLVIDGVDISKGGHNTPPDIISLNVLFYNRRASLYPTVVVCSDTFWSSVTDSRYEGGIVSRWGDEFYSMLRDNKNLVIELFKEEDKVVG